MSTKNLAKELGLIRSRRQSSAAHPRVRKQRFPFLIIIDFESTCWREKNSSGQEIIEFPAVLLNVSSGEVESEFHTFVQPQEHPVLSEFCTELTGITQDQVDSAPPLHICLSRFARWLLRLQQERGVVFETDSTGPAPSGHPCAFVTWSDWDLGVCLLYECKRKQLSVPEALKSWIDLRATYRLFYNRKPKGLRGALLDLGIQFTGREHSGLVDARNTALLAWRMVCDGCLLSITKSLRRAPVKPRPPLGNISSVCRPAPSEAQTSVCRPAPSEAQTSVCRPAPSEAQTSVCRPAPSEAQTSVCRPAPSEAQTSVCRPAPSEAQTSVCRPAPSEAQTSVCRPAPSEAQTSVCRPAPSEAQTSVCRPAPSEAQTSVCRPAPSEVQTSVCRPAPSEAQTSVCRPAPSEAQTSVCRPAQSEAQTSVCRPAPSEAQTSVCRPAPSEAQTSVCRPAPSEAQTSVCRPAPSEAQTSVCRPAPSEAQTSVCRPAPSEAQTSVCRPAPSEAQTSVCRPAPSEAQTSVCRPAQSEAQTSVCRPAPSEAQTSVCRPAPSEAQTSVCRPAPSEAQTSVCRPAPSEAQTSVCRPAPSEAQTSVCRPAPSEVQTSVCRPAPSEAQTSVCRPAPSEAQTSVCRPAPSEAQTSVCRPAPSEAQTSVCRALVAPRTVLSSTSTPRGDRQETSTTALAGLSDTTYDPETPDACWTDGVLLTEEEEPVSYDDVALGAEPDENIPSVSAAVFKTPKPLARSDPYGPLSRFLGHSSAPFSVYRDPPIAKPRPPLSGTGGHSSKRTAPLCGCGRRARRLTVGNGGPNHGRGFYSCPARRQTHTGCGLFQWESGSLQSRAPNQIRAAQAGVRALR